MIQQMDEKMSGEKPSPFQSANGLASHTHTRVVEWLVGDSDEKRTFVRAAALGDR